MSKKNQWFLNGFLFPYLYLFGRFITYLGFVSGGLNNFGDLTNYFEVGALKGYPFFSYWVEYPPVFPLINKWVYQLSGGNTLIYDFVFFFIFALFGSACIYIFYKLACDLWGEDAAIVRTILLFALLLPLPYTWWYFELIPVAMMLCALLYVNRNHKKAAGGMIALGMLTKWFPVLLIPAVWKFKSKRDAITITLIALSITALVLGGLFVLSPTMTKVSLISQPGRNSWQTIWAWIDGNYMTGAFAYPESRYNPDYLINNSIGNPPLIPSWLRLILFGLIGLFLFWKVKIKSTHSLASFFGITWVVFLLWSSGWSPQWILYLIPLILLTFPIQKALFWNFILILFTMLEWPTLLGHQLFFLMGPIAVIRSILLVALGIFWYRFTQQEYKE